MKKPYDTQLPRRSVREIVGGFDAELNRQINVKAEEFFESQLTAEALMNAIMLHFLELPQDSRDEILGRYIKKFEAMMAIEEEKTSRPSHGDRDLGMGGTLKAPTYPGKRSSKKA